METVKKNADAKVAIDGSKVQTFYGAVMGAAITKELKLKKIEAAILHFQTILKCEHVIATGSYALYKFGIVKSVGDLDIRIISPTDEALEILQKLQDAELSKHLQIDYLNKMKGMYRILYDGIKIDFFTQSDVGQEIFLRLDSGIKLSTVPALITAKKQAGRLKDILQLRDMSHLFYQEAMLTGFITAETQRIKTDACTCMEHELVPPAKPEVPDTNVVEPFDISDIEPPIKPA